MRVVGATNMNMMDAIREGRFREDLYYRLNAVPINIPPLRERKKIFHCCSANLLPILLKNILCHHIKLNEEAETLLKNHYWKGNVRQLKNLTEQISVIEQNRNITAETLNRYLSAASTEPAVFIAYTFRFQNIQQRTRNSLPSVVRYEKRYERPEKIGTRNYR